MTLSKPLAQWRFPDPEQAFSLSSRHYYDEGVFPPRDRGDLLSSLAFCWSSLGGGRARGLHQGGCF